MRNDSSPSGAGLIQRRHQAIEFMLNGEPPLAVARACGLSLTAVNRLASRFRKGGWPALVALGDGPLPSKQRRLSNAQEEDIIHAMRTGTPEDLGMEGPLWDRRAVMELMFQRTGHIMTRSTVNGYLKRWGFLRARSNRHAMSDDPVSMRAWRKATYPLILADARISAHEVQWLSAWPLGPQDLHVLMVSTSRGHAQWRVHAGPVDGTALLAFVEGLHRSHGGGLTILMLPELYDLCHKNLVRRHPSGVRIHPLPRHGSN